MVRPSGSTTRWQSPHRGGSTPDQCWRPSGRAARAPDGDRSVRPSSRTRIRRGGRTAVVASRAVSSVSTGCSSHCTQCTDRGGRRLRERRHEISFLGDGEAATGRRAPARRTTRPLSAGAGGDRGCRSTATRNGPDPRLDTPRDGHHSRRRLNGCHSPHPPSAHLPGSRQPITVPDVTAQSRRPVRTHRR